MALGLLLGCQSHNAYGPGKDAGADGQKTLAGVVSYIRQHEQRMPYLQERNFSANDLVVSKADCSITDDTIYVKIPFVIRPPHIVHYIASACLYTCVSTEIVPNLRAVSVSLFIFLAVMAFRTVPTTFGGSYRMLRGHVS